MKICIVTTRHISYNPRVLKEADTFASEGYEVTVVTINNHNRQYRFDQELMKTRTWSLKTINFRRENKKEILRWIALSLKQKMFSFLAKVSFRFGIAERASLKGFSELVTMAKREKADFYIAHHAEALAIAYQAAKTNRAKFGFDAEDFHSGMNESKTLSSNDTMTAFLENKYLPHCNYLTAASKGIGEAYSKKYNIKPATVILNVFPEEEVLVKEIAQPVKFYWYSQVIGPNRSLETLVEAASKLKEDFEIHLRGSFHSDEYKALFDRLIKESGLEHKIFFYQPILAEKIIPDAARFDVGLALESDISVNRNICVTNKIFSYLMSGLAIIGTDTYGQKDIFSEFTDAVEVCLKSNAEDLARAMKYFIQNPDKLHQAKLAAREAALRRYNWEFESKKLIHSFEKTLNHKREFQSAVESNHS